MKLLTFLLAFTMVYAQFGEKPKVKPSEPNIEIRGTYVKDNPNFIYLESKTEKIKLKKAELTKEGVQQILANKEVELTLFVPAKAITHRVEKPKEGGEEY